LQAACLHLTRGSRHTVAECEESARKAQVGHFTPMKKKFMLRAAVVAVAAFTLFGSSSPAIADVPHKVGSDTTGSEAWGWYTGEWVVDDTKCDGHAAYARLIESGHSGEQRKNNRDGCDTTESGDTGNAVLEIKACIDRNNLPDFCGPWNEWVW